MTSIPSLSGQLKLGDILAASGIHDLTEVLAIRHTAQAEGIPDVSHATPEAVLAYMREQDVRSSVFPKQVKSTVVVCEAVTT